MLGAMASVRAPKAVQPASPATIVDAQRLHDRLYEKHRIEVPVIPFDGRLWIRLSAQIYNQREDYMALASALESGRD
jgi:isopenicillin-N epimerase